MILTQAEITNYQDKKRFSLILSDEKPTFGDYVLYKGVIKKFNKDRSTEDCFKIISSSIFLFDQIPVYDMTEFPYYINQHFCY